MLISFSILKKNGTHKKIKHLKKKNYCDNCYEHAKGLLKHHQFPSSFEQ